jgi:hypothetical protein
MGRYQAASGSAGTASFKSEPKGLPAEAFGQAMTPAEQVVQKTPWYVMINNSGSYHFLYSPASTLGATVTSGYTLGIQTKGALGQPVKLDINPSAWSGSDGTYAAGDVTFVYRGGL